MAQTQHREPATETNLDSEAWKVAAAARKYCIYDGKVWSGGAGMLFALDPLPGFASLPASVQPLVFQSVAQFVTNRVGQVAEGDVQAAITACLTSGTMPGANTNDAFERHYINCVTDRVNAVLGALPANASAEDKATREKAILATALKRRGGKPDSEEDLFIVFRDSGIAASHSKPITEKKRKPKAAADLTAAVEIA